MGSKENSKQLWVDAQIIHALELRRRHEGRVEAMVTYVENILAQYASGKLVSKILFDETFERLKKTTDMLEAMMRLVAAQPTRRASDLGEFKVAEGGQDHGKPGRKHG